MTPESIDALLHDKDARIHFVGLGGTGMSAYADFRNLSGGKTSGSDRGFDQGRALAQRDGFVARGITVFPQDGSGVAGAAAIVVSAAVEVDVPDYASAVAAGVPIITRKEWLAAHYRSYPSIAITGTSGKSSVTAMVFEVLRGAGLNPGLITGADLISLLDANVPGNAAAGTGPLVLEADESDKGIADYFPQIGMILNLQRDHDEPDVMLRAFDTFKNNCRQTCVLSDDPALAPLRNGCIIVGVDDHVNHRITGVDLLPDTSTFKFDGHTVMLPVPGYHNVTNAAAALAVGLAAGADLEKMIKALAVYRGVARRFQIVGSGNGIEVIDDYAHNPAKIAAVIRTAARRSDRTIMWYQPHGFGPTRFMRPDLVAMFAAELRPQDVLYIAPIYYVGGTAAQDISTQMLIDDLAARGRTAHYAPTQESFIADVQRTAKSGDCVVVVGGRDPLLPGFARQIANTLTK